MDPAVGERATPPLAPISVGTVLADRYRLAARVAAGGMATIYRARDELLDRDVAVKVLHPHLAEEPSAFQRFQVEARAAAGLSSPHVVSVFDQGVEGLPFIVMEYVDGPSLRDVLALRHRLPPGEALAILEPVCAALARAHDAGLVHRDVKPENVLVASEDGTVKVADFGIARVLAAARITDSDMLVGSVHYLAPEVVLGGEASPASDQYAVGLVLFELLTGRKPFSGGSRQAVALRRSREPVPLPSRFVTGVGLRLDAVVAVATALDPKARYPDLLAFARALRDAVPQGPEAVLVPGRDATDGTLIIPYDALETAIIGASRPSAPLRDPAEPGAAAETAGAGDRRRPSRTLVLSCTAVLLTLAGLVSVVLPVRTVPAVAATTSGEAEAALVAAGLRPVIGAPVASTAVPEGLVLGTRPGAGARLRNGAAVSLTLSSGPQEVTVPSVLASDRDDAVARLQGPPYGFRVRVEEAHSATGAPAGTVQAQAPAAGESVDTGAAVVVNVSLGAPPVTVPELAGTERDAAQRRLTGAGLGAVFREEYSDLQPVPGRVIAQSPAAGEQVAGTSPVEVVVSRGPRTLVLPDLRLRPIEEARAALAALDLSVRVSEEPPPQFGPFVWGTPGLVERQSPAAGSEVVRGQEVVLSTWAAPAAPAPAP